MLIKPPQGTLYPCILVEIPIWCSLLLVFWGSSLHHSCPGSGVGLLEFTLSFRRVLIYVPSLGHMCVCKVLQAKFQTIHTVDRLYWSYLCRLVTYIQLRAVQWYSVYMLLCFSYSGFNDI